MDESNQRVPKISPIFIRNVQALVLVKVKKLELDVDANGDLQRSMNIRVFPHT
jgi:hypothetical protein